MIKRNNGKFLAFLLVSIIAISNFYLIFTNNALNVYAEEEKNSELNYFDSLSMVNFIKNNLTEFTTEYNKISPSGEQLNATSIEYSTTITILEDNVLANYIDFNDNNGHLIVDEKKNIYDIQTSGDLPELRKLNNLAYSYIDGFLQKDTNDNYIKIYQNKEALPADSAQYLGQKKVSTNTTRQGNSEQPDGKIMPGSLPGYISENYPHLVFDSKITNLSDDFDFMIQFRTSFYVKTDTNADGTFIDGPWSEGNCALNALYQVMLNWQKKGFISGLPTGTINYLPLITSDTLYPYYGTGVIRQTVENLADTTEQLSSGNNSQIKYYRWNTNDTHLPNIPRLYQQIRNFAVTFYDYTPETGFMFDNIIPLGEYIANILHDNNIEIQKNSTITSALEDINTKAVFLGINNSSTYKNHGVVLLGYHKYAYTYQFLNFTHTFYYYFYEIADGWYFTPKILDPYVSEDIELFPYSLV